MPHDDIRERTKHLVGQLFDAMTDASGTPSVPFDKLHALVKADPEAAAAAIPTLLKAGEKERGFYQFAQAIAAAYEMETKDDSLSKGVDAVVSKLAKPLKPIRVLGADAPAGSSLLARTPSKPKVGVISVDPNDLAKGDVFPLVRLFRIDEARFDPASVKTLRGVIILTFPVDDDPRPVWQIPAVRTHQQKLFAQVPYFPYYLDPHPKIGMFMTFFGPLADLSSVSAEGIDLAHPSLVKSVVTSMKAVSTLAKRLGENPDEVCRWILQAMPGDFINDVLTRAKA